jgi:hypothetical protein
MGSKSRVVMHAQQAVALRTPEEKLNALARAIAELADFVDDLENKLIAIDRKMPH